MQFKIENTQYHFKYPINVRGKKVAQTNMTTLTHEHLTHSFLTIENFHQTQTDERIELLINYFEKFDTTEDFKLILPQHKNPEIDFLINSIFFNLNISSHYESHFNFLFNDDTQNYFGTLKIKLENEIILSQAFIGKIKQLINEPKIIKIRFDGNQNLHSHNLKIFLDSFSVSELEKIEYVEEPFLDIFDSIDFLKNYNLDIGIDESLEQFICSKNSFPTNSFAIIKPSLLGFSNSLNLISELSKKHIPSIISSGYELESDLCTLISLAVISDKYNQHEYFHGLDTFKFLNGPLSKIFVKDNKISL